MVRRASQQWQGVQQSAPLDFVRRLGRRVQSWPDWALLGGLWLVGVLLDRLWFGWDHSAPGWDQAEYLTAALTYGRALQEPQWFSGAWWVDFWRLSPKVPPLVAIATVPFLWLFGPSADAATLLNSACSLVLLGSVYVLGRRWFDRATGLWAAALCLWLPGLWRVRLDYLTDFPLVAAVTAVLAALVLWAMGDRVGSWGARRSSWTAAIALGFLLGLGLLVKQPVVFFVAVPLLAVLGWDLWRSRWEHFFQGLVALGMATAIAGPWYRTNWLFILSGGKRATIDSALAEGDPALGSIDAWTYYLKLVPQHVSWPILGVAIAGGCLWLVRYQRELAWPSAARLRPAGAEQPIDASTSFQRGWAWLALVWVGAYLLCSLLVNKDWRYGLPYWPVGAIALARGWLMWRSTVRWGALAVTAAVTLLSWLPISAAWVAPLVPGPARVVQLGPALPHAQVVQAVIDRAPWVRSTVGVLPSTVELNQHNLNFFGAARNFQVYGRQVGTDPQAIAQDARSLDWYLLKTGDQGSMRGRRRREAQSATIQAIRTSPELTMVDRWPLADGSEWQLFQRRQPSVQGTSTTDPATDLRLTATLPERVPPGQVVPVDYLWQGTGEALDGAIALLTWQREPTPDRPPGRTGWIDDRAVGRGRVMIPRDRAATALRVRDHSAMVLPPDLAPGRYRLWASLIPAAAATTDRVSLTPVPTTATVIVDPAAPVPAAPELDGVAELRLLGLQLRSGRAGLDALFATIGRINQYDPTQAYVQQAEVALRYRLAQQPDRLGWRYALALANTLDQNTTSAISNFEAIVRQEPANPWAHAYLAVVNLYDFRTAAAWPAIQRAIELSPRTPEFHYLKAVAHLQRWEPGRAIAEARIAQSLEAAIGKPQDR